MGASRNGWLWSALGITAVLEVMALIVAPLRQLLGLEAPGAIGLLLGCSLALVPLALVQVWRGVVHWRRHAAGT